MSTRDAFTQEGSVVSVDTTVPAPLSITKIAKFINMLVRYGVNGPEIDRFLDDVIHRSEVVRLMRGQEEPLIAIGNTFDQGAIERLIKHIFSQYGKRDVSAFCTRDVIAALLEGLPPLSIAIVVLRSGLRDGSDVPVSEVASRLGLSTSHVATMRGEATKHMMARQRALYPLEPEVPRTLPVPSLLAVFNIDSQIEDMKLSVRAYNCMKREGIHTVRALTEKSRDDLMSVRNLGMKLIDEIEAQLVHNGLSLSR